MNNVLDEPWINEMQWPNVTPAELTFRVLKAHWSEEAENDLYTFHGIDLRRPTQDKNKNQGPVNWLKEGF